MASCLTGASALSADGGTSTLDEVARYSVSSDNLVYVATGTPAPDAPDDIRIDLAPTDEDTAGVDGEASLAAWTRDTGGVPGGDLDVDFTVSSFDTLRGVAKCAVYVHGRQLVHDSVQGSKPVAHCPGHFDAEDLR